MHTTAKVPQKAAAQKTTKQSFIKKEVTPLPMPVGTSSSRGKMTEVPQFMETMWSSSFLPTIYDSLGHLTKPFTDFFKGIVIVSKLQEAINLVWPGMDYSIQWLDLACTKVNDSCCFNKFLIGSNSTLQAMDHLNEKCAWFGSEAFRLVDCFFQGEDYVNNPSNMHNGPHMVTALLYT